MDRARCGTHVVEGRRLAPDPACRVAPAAEPRPNELKALEHSLHVTSLADASGRAGRDPTGEELASFEHQLVEVLVDASTRRATMPG
jgi:hypothetical protein